MERFPFPIFASSMRLRSSNCVMWTWNWRPATTGRGVWRKKPPQASRSMGIRKTQRVCAAFSTNTKSPQGSSHYEHLSSPSQCSPSPRLHRIGILDFVFLNQGYQYLETEPDKVRFFCGTLNIQKHYLPAKLYLGRKTSSTSVRYFVDKFPMFLCSSSPVVTFTYMHEGAETFTDFVRHLENYLPLFRQISEFRLVYASRTDAQFEKATEIFASLVKIPLESDVSGDLLRYFRVRKAWDEKQYAAVTDADLIFRNHARARFTGERFEGLYRGWKNGRVNESGIRQELGTNDRKHTIGFETFLLRRIAPATDSPNTE